MANPGLVFLTVVVAVGQAALGVSALTDGRTLHGVVGLTIATCFAGWAVVTLRRRRDRRGQVS